MEQILLKITERMSELGYESNVFFPEMNKINNIIKNGKGNVSKYILDCSRRAYELGIQDEILDNLLSLAYLQSIESL